MAEADTAEAALFPQADTDIGDRDNVTDWCLQQFRTHYGNAAITKDDTWEYLYGAMHAPDWRERYRHDLQRSLPRVPLAPDFEAFRAAGGVLAWLCPAAVRLSTARCRSWQLTAQR